MAFLLNSQRKVYLAKMNNLPKHHGAGPQRRGAQCSCIGCIGLRPALIVVLQQIKQIKRMQTLFQQHVLMPETVQPDCFHKSKLFSNICAVFIFKCKRTRQIFVGLCSVYPQNKSFNEVSGEDERMKMRTTNN